MQLPELYFKNQFEFSFRENKDTIYIYDILRKTYLLLTPEEWVRQHWIHYYHKVLGIGLSSMISEKKVELHKTIKRIDLLILEKNTPKILVECKAPAVPLTQKTFEQIARYNSVIGAKEIVLSNGLQHIYAEFLDNEYHFKEFE